MRLNNPRTTVTASSGSPSKLPELLSISHPFVQQLDVLFPSNTALEQRLQALSGTYRKGRLELCQVLDAAYSLTGKYSTQNDLLALSLGSIDTEDVWCIDHRGLLTLALTKETYYQLGLVGEKQSKKSKDKFVVRINLHDRNSNIFTRAKESFRSWDERRTSQGVGPWEVLLQGSSNVLQSHLELELRPHCATFPDILVPETDMSNRESSEDALANEELAEEWQEHMAELFEWVGMACIGSERIKANDRANPYVALYETPSPSMIGSVSTLRWRGLLGPAMVQKILETVIDSIKNDSSRPKFVAVTANTFAGAPISYISPKAFAEGAKNEVRLGHSARFVRCWSLIVKPGKDGEAEWTLANVEAQI